MEMSVSARNLELTPRLDDYVQRKIGKLDRYLSHIDDAHVELKVEQTRSADQRQVAQLTVRSRGAILRAEERTGDMFASIDAVMDKMYRQIARYKGKRQDRWHGAGDESMLDELPIEEPAEESAGEIVRVKRFPMRPMMPEEAVEQMLLLGHQFYVFLNAEENSVNVVYQRDNGDFGLLQPELI